MNFLVKVHLRHSTWVIKLVGLRLPGMLEKVGARGRVGAFRSPSYSRLTSKRSSWQSNRISSSIDHQSIPSGPFQHLFFSLSKSKLDLGFVQRKSVFKSIAVMNNELWRNVRVFLVDLPNKLVVEEILEMSRSTLELTHTLRLKWSESKFTQVLWLIN